jgi:phosphonate transport system substrate-binding protein
MRPRSIEVSRRAILAGAMRAVLALLCLAALAGPAARAQEPLTFAVVPQFEQRKLFAIWRPILDEVSRRTGVPLRLEATLSVPEFENALSAGQFDFVYTNPYHVFRERQRQGYLPLVRDEVPLHGLIVVARGAPIRDVKELAGQTLAVPSPNSLGASLLVRADLLRAHGVRVELLAVKTHTSAYLHVATGLAPAAGGVDKTLQEQPAEIRDALRVLYRTGDVASHPIAAHPRVPAGVRAAVQRALLEMGATPEGAALLAKIPLAKPVVARHADYDDFATLRLEEFWDTK